MSAQEISMTQTVRNRIVAPLWMSLFASVPILAADIEPPQISPVDKLGVNMANGQVTHSLSTVSIGGAMGLSHNVSVHANEFDYIGYRGFQDKFYSMARNAQICPNPAVCAPSNVFRVYDFEDTVSFAYYAGGVLQQTGNAISGFTYVAIGDERHTLEVVASAFSPTGTDLLWTKPDGTEVRFYRGTGSLPASQAALLRSIKYPNGFMIFVNSGGAAVNTNTGFQIKHFYEPDNRPLDKVAPPGLNAPLVSSSWQIINPKYVRAINAAVIYCEWSTVDCTNRLNQRPELKWPTATFEWPAGMPRTMYIGDSTVKVTDAAGLTTNYTFRAYDLAYDTEFGNVVSPYTPGRDFSPRLVGITPPGGTATKITYDYKNMFAGAGDPLGCCWWSYRLQSAGVIKRATRVNAAVNYDMLRDYMGEILNTAGGDAGITNVHLQDQFGLPGALYYIDTDLGRVWYEGSSRNFIRQFDRNAGSTETYTYTRGNLTTTTYGGAASVLAEYPASCTSATRKTCNKPTRTRDRNGNWTDYEYHPSSGQVSKITYPTNKTLVLRPETRFTYALKYATYYNEFGSLVTSSDGIWLKTEERYCINSNAASGVCAANDEVVTTYEYNHPNLLTTGMTVTAPGGATRRTCYRYDMYGNQIGVTTPNANAASCPAGVVP